MHCLLIGTAIGLLILGFSTVIMLTGSNHMSNRNGVSKLIWIGTNASRAIIAFSYLFIVVEMLIARFYLTEFPKMTSFRATYYIICIIFSLTMILQLLHIYVISPSVLLIWYMAISAIMFVTSVSTWLILSYFIKTCDFVILQKKQIDDLHYVISCTQSTLVEEEIKQKMLDGLSFIFPDKHYKFVLGGVRPPLSDPDLSIRFIPLTGEERLYVIETDLKMLIPQNWLDTLAQSVNLSLKNAEVMKKVVKASEMKTEFLLTISHEIRTPLTGVINMLDLLATTSIDSEQADYVATARSSGKLLMVIINDILDFSKLGTHTLKLQPEVFEPLAFCKEIELCVMANSSLQSVEVHLTVEQHDTVKPFNLMGDTARILQVVMGVANNAMKFTQRGIVNVDIQFGCAVDGYSNMVVIVEDNGPGIPDSVMQVLYEPFVKDSVHCRYKNTGTGLGLAIANQLIIMMCGKLDIKTKKGVGTRVAIDIPLKIGRRIKKIGSMMAPAELKLPVLPPNQCKILLAEDNVVNQKVLTRILSKLGYNNVKLVIDGEEALTVLESEGGDQFDVVLLDNLMPKMNGDEVCKRLREKGRKDILICVSANILTQDDEYFLKVGMDDVVSKPVDINELKIKLERWTTQNVS